MCYYIYIYHLNKSRYSYSNNLLENAVFKINFKKLDLN